MKRPLSLVLVVALAASGCASGYTVVDRSGLVISDNARISAASVLPGGQKNPRAANHLALAQEVYQKQLDLLKERRNKVRARRRILNLTSFGVLAASAIAVGSVAMASGSRSTQKGAGGGAMCGLALGTGLQIGSLMQEDVAVVDDKIRHLQSSYEAMIDRVGVFAVQPPSEQNDAAIGAAIEGFINEALRINVKG